MTNYTDMMRNDVHNLRQAVVVFGYDHAMSVAHEYADTMPNPTLAREHYVGVVRREFDRFTSVA